MTTINSGSTIPGPGDNPPDYSLSNDSIFGQYRIIRPLGRGGMGEVYEAEHTTLKRRYALKLLPASFASQAGAVDRFRSEAKIMANLEHPHIVRVDDFGEVAGRYWLRMELVHGVGGGTTESGKSFLPGGAVTLSEYAAACSSGRIEQNEFAQIFGQFLEALAYAHEKGVVHRDLKPGNVLLESQKNRLCVKVSDFGLARVIGEAAIRTQAQLSLSHTGSIGDASTIVEGGGSKRALVGTYEYMSPEQKRGEEADERSDVYAVGLMCYRLLTGRDLGMKRPSEIIRGLNPQWDGFVVKATEQEPTERFANGAEALEALNAIKISLVQPKVQAPPPLPPKPPPQPKPEPAVHEQVTGKRSYGMVWGIVLAGIVLSVLFASMFHRAHTPFIINASADNGGSIWPIGDVTVNNGGGQTFTASPDSEYKISQWLVDGTLVQTGGSSFTLSNIRANHSIQVTFNNISVPPPRKPPQNADNGIDPGYEHAKTFFNLGQYDHCCADFEQEDKVQSSAPSGVLWLYILASAYLRHGEVAGTSANRFTQSFGWNAAENNIPLSLYAALFGYAGYRQAGDESNADQIIANAAAQGNSDRWPYPIISYLHGDIDISALSTSVGNNQNFASEANTFIGFKDLYDNKPDDAIGDFVSTLEYGNKDKYEYILALSELRHLENPQLKDQALIPDESEEKQAQNDYDQVEIFFKSADYANACDEFKKVFARYPRPPVSSLIYYVTACANIGSGDSAGQFSKVFLDAFGWKRQESSAIILYGYTGYLQAGNTDAARQLLDDGVEKGDASRWPYSLLLCLQGKIDPATLYSQIGNNRSFIADAKTFLGIQELYNGNTTDASADLVWVQENRQVDVMDYTLATYELSQLYRSPSAPPPPPTNQPPDVNQIIQQAQQGIPLTVDEVKILGQAHLSDDYIIGLIHQSHASYTLDATQVLQLTQAGISQSVINFMLATAQGGPSAQGGAPTQAGSLKVTTLLTGISISNQPKVGVGSGGQWQVDGGPWQTSGTILTGISVGRHVVSYSNVQGFITPGNQTVSIRANQTTSAVGTYFGIRLHFFGN